MDGLHMTEPLRLHGVTLIVIQRVRVEASREGSGSSLFAFAKPWSIVTEERGQWRAMDMDGSEMALEPLTKDVEGLASLVR